MNEIPKVNERRKPRAVRYTGSDRRNKPKPKEPWCIPNSVLDGIVLLAVAIFIFSLLHKMAEL